MKRILILTASFGEGHNTAARGMRDALRVDFPQETQVDVSDLYRETNPSLNRGMQQGYSFLINRATLLWRLVFVILSIRGLLEFSLPLLSALRRALTTQIRDFQPDVIVSTYPIYSFLIHKIRATDVGARVPLVTVITDSTSINSAWYRQPSDYFVVADELTATAIRTCGVEPNRIRVMGFPVSLKFDALDPLPANAGPPWRLLFMPSTKRRLAIRAVSKLLELPDVRLTLLTGRHESLATALKQAGYGADERVKIMGWTDQMPELLASHHLYLGKAGGAIVQEAVAAGTPFLISHVVPGQEEGNIALIEQTGMGARVSESPEALARKVREAFAADAALWKQWKQNVLANRRIRAARTVAGFLMEVAGKSGSG